MAHIAAFANVLLLAQKLQRDKPKDMELAALNFAIAQLGEVIRTIPSTAVRPVHMGYPQPKTKRRPPHYWRDQKRRRRARAKVEKAIEVELSCRP